MDSSPRTQTSPSIGSDSMRFFMRSLSSLTVNTGFSMAYSASVTASASVAPFSPRMKPPRTPFTKATVSGSS